jgi:hypothetical protein
MVDPKVPLDIRAKYEIAAQIRSASRFAEFCPVLLDRRPDAA